MVLYWWDESLLPEGASLSWEANRFLDTKRQMFYLPLLFFLVSDIFLGHFRIQTHSVNTVALEQI